jgi:hypothetical protein
VRGHDVAGRAAGGGARAADNHDRGAFPRPRRLPRAGVCGKLRQARWLLLLLLLLLLLSCTWQYSRGAGACLLIIELLLW